MKKTGFVGGITLAVILFIVLIGVAMCTTRVPAGYVAIQYNSMGGGVQKEVLTQGWHLVAPNIKTTLYAVGLNQSYLTKGKKGDSKDNERFTSSSSEGKSMAIDLTFTYQYSAENVVDLFTRFKGQSGEDVRDGFIKPNIISWTKEVIARYKVSDVLGEKRSEVNAALTEYLSGKFTEYGITVSNVSLINVEVDKDTQKAINNKITAQQSAEAQAITNQMAIDKANADAEVARTQAQASADAKLIEANAEAEANAKISASLTPGLLEKIKYEKWNGKLPSVSGSSTPIIDMEN